MKKNSLFQPMLKLVTTTMMKKTSKTSVRVHQKAILIYGKEDLTHEPVVNKCCSSAKWVPIEVLEEGYGHRFGL